MKLSNKLKTLVAAPVLATSLMIAAPQASAGGPETKCLKGIVDYELIDLKAALKAYYVACKTEDADKAEAVMAKILNKQIARINKKLPRLAESGKCDPDIQADIDDIVASFPLEEVSAADFEGEFDDIIGICDGELTPEP